MVKYNVYGAEVDIQIPKDVFPTKEEIEAMDNSIPGCQYGWFESCYEKSKLFYRYWLPKGEPKGVVVFMHGVSTHTGKGLEIEGRKLSNLLLVDSFLEKGLAVYVYEQYGHGFSEGIRTLIPKTWENNKQDYINFSKMAADRHSKDIPFFLAGESYGGTLTIHVAKHFQDHPEDGPANFDSFLLIAPAVVADMPPFPVYQLLRYVLAPNFPNWVPFFMPNPISPDRIWRDDAVRKLRTAPRYKEMMIDAGGLPLKLGTALGIVIAMEEAQNKAIPGLIKPFCIVHGTGDEGVLMEGSEYLMKHCATPDDLKELHKIDGAMHDILGDPLAEKSMGHLTAFVAKRLESFKKD